jgi:hypothetical protein
MVRLSFGACTTFADLDRVLDAIALLATTSGRAAATAGYTQGPDGTWARAAGERQFRAATGAG